MEERYHCQLLDKLNVILFWQGEKKIVADRSAAPGLEKGYIDYAPSKSCILNNNVYCSIYSYLNIIGNK